MNLFSVLHAQALVVFLFLGAQVVLLNPRSVLNRTISVIMLCFAVWNLGDVFHHDPAQTLESVRFWANIGAIGWVTFPVLFVVFAVALERRFTTRMPGWTYPLMAVPPALFFWQQLAGNLNAAYVSTPDGWSTVWSTSIWVPLYFGYYAAAMVVGMTLVIRFWVTARHPRERIQARLFTVTGIAALLLGTFSNVVLPVVFRRESIEVAPLVGLIWAAGLVVGVARYGMLSITPQSAADAVLAAMRDAVVLISPNGRVEFANKATQDLLGRRPEELRGVPAAELLGRKIDFDLVNRHILGGGPLGPWETDLFVRGGRRISISVTGRTMHARQGETVGHVWVLRDTSRRKQAERDLVKAYEQLEQRVRERTAQLAASNRDLQEEIASHRDAERERDRHRRELQALFDNTDVLLWSIREDDSGELWYERVNRAFAAIEGFEPDHYNGRRLAEVHSPDEIKHIRYSVSRARSGKPHVYPVTFGRGPEPRHFEIRLIPLVEPDGSIRRFIGAGADVTGYHRALAELEKLRGPDGAARPV